MFDEEKASMQSENTTKSQTQGCFDVERKDVQTWNTRKFRRGSEGCLDVEHKCGTQGILDMEHKEVQKWNDNLISRNKPSLNVQEVFYAKL